MQNYNGGYMSMLDVITLLSFILQMDNAQEDKVYKTDIQEFEKMIKNEVNKMHKENDLILKKLDEIRSLL